MSCVNRNTKEFRDTVSRLDVHPDNLEVVLHKILNTTGEENPTDSEIMRELKGKPFKASMDSFRWYTRQLLYKPLTYGNLEKAMSSANNLRGILSDDAVSVYRNSSGEYIVSVGTPKSNNMPFVLDNTLIDTLMDSVRETNPYHQIFKSLVDLIGKPNISIRQGLASENSQIAEGRNPAAFFPDRNEIIFFPEHLGHLNNYEEAGRKSYIFQTLTHELVHQFAFNTLDKNPESLRTEAERTFHKDITNLYEEAKKSIGEDEYGMTNVQEFIAEALTNRKFQRKLAEIKSNKKSIWQRLVEAFNRAFKVNGIDISNTLLADVLSSTEEFMSRIPEINAQELEEMRLRDEIFEEEMNALGSKSPQRITQEQVQKWESEVKSKISEFNRTQASPDASVARDFVESLMRDYPWYIVEDADKFIKKESNGTYNKSKGYTSRWIVSFNKGKRTIGNNTATANSRINKAIEAAELERQRKQTEKDLNLTEKQEEWLHNLEEMGRQDLANKVRDGLLDINELMLHEDEITLFASPVNQSEGETIKAPEENPFNISKVDESKRQQYAVDTGITIDHIEHPIKEDYENYSPVEVTIVTSDGNRIQLAPKAGYQDPSKVIKSTSDIKSLIGLNYLLEQYLRTYPEEVYKIGHGFLSDASRSLHGLDYDVSRDPFVTDYIGYVEATTGQQTTKPTPTRESIQTPEGRVEAAKLLNKEKILDVKNTVDGGLGIAIKSTNPDIDRVVVSFNKKRNLWEARAQFKEGINKDEIWATQEQQQEVVDKFVPKDLQEYFTSGQYKSDDKVLNDEAGKSEKSISERAKEISQGHEGSDQVIRDKWGIYFFNEYTGEDNWIPNSTIVPADYNTNESRPTDETNERLYEYSGEFEGASNYLVGIVPDNLLRKVEDYLMSGEQTELSEADALEFLKYANSLYETEERTEDTINQEENNQEPIKKENKSFMDRAALINQQIDNLNNSTALSATEVRHVAEQAVYWISDAITEYMENPESLFTNFPEKRTMEGEGEEKTWTDENKAEDIDKVKAMESRADVVRFIGPDALIALCKAKFSPENADYESFDTIEKAEVITDNWDAIMMLASDVFLSVEDFSIVSSRDGKTREVNTDITADADNFNESNMQSDVEENEGSLQEHWQVETKTLDILATMSQMVRQALQKCYLLDKDGNYIKSEFGINERVNAREATNSILRWTQGALDLADMIKMLEEKSESNPWVTQLIDRLSDTTGKEADFQGQFFGTFCKHFQSYSVVIEEDGKFKSIQVNENPALSEAMTQVTTQYKIGEHPLFTNEGINRTSFSELKTSFEDLGKYKGKDFTEEEKMEAANTLGYISNLLGYYVTPEMVADNLNKDTFKRMYSALSYIVPTLERNLDNKTYEPFKFKGNDGISGNTREFLRPITEHLEDIAVSAFYDSGKMYQSYITPSYTSKLFQKFKQSGAEFDKFMQDEYGQFEWFKDPKTVGKIERGWRNQWLKLLATDSKAKEIFKHKVQLNFNKHNYMRDMSDMEYALSLFTEYFSENASEKQSRVPAWFRVPMLSNKPSSEFIRFYSERGSNYRDVLTSGFKMIFDQELSRIQTVEMRNRSKKDKRLIKNFDKNGRKFVFLDFMNDYLKGGSKERSSLGRLIRAKLDGAHLSSSNEMALLKQVKEVIMETMEARAEAIVSQWGSQGIVKAAEKVANVGTSEAEVRDSLKNFVWNDTFAAMNIMQLTITDPAFYKDAEDLQKRLAQIHAPGVRGNVNATDYEGKAVTDGKFRTIKLTDFDSFISNIIDNVSVVFDRKIERVKTESEKKALRALKDSLVGKDGAYRKINVADAQGYSSPSSYRKKALIFGKWSKQAEDIYQKLKEGNYTYNDLKTAFQPLKPFVYSQIEKESGSANAPMSKLKVPVQFKNSEYLLIMADALTRNENTGKPNILRAIYDVMENSHYDNNGNYRTDGIDTVQFESTVKSGLMGRISLNDLLNDPHGEAVAKARMETAVYNEDGTYNNITVDTVPFEDYCLQQEVPEHFKEHEQAHGSQLRYIIASELEDTNYLGEKMTYNLEGKQVSAKEFKDAYEQTIADNIQESIDELAEELSLNSIESIKDRNIALSKILQREILSSPRYGVDLLQACSVDENGRFRIPLGDPIQSKRVEQLINSIIKNRINKQKIAGGPVVQVTNFGTSKELNIRFKDKNGNLLMTRAEYEKKPVKREVSQVDRFNARYKKKGETPNTSDTMSYEDYIKENQAGIAYFEVFAPIYSNKLFEQFADQNGVINIQAIEELDPDLLKMIGYRIPTEDKYSMAPLKIVGFLPREAGDGIMLPNDITLLTGSDFDVDKEYLMRKDYSIKKNDISRSKMRGILYDELIASQKGKLSYDIKSQLNELIDQFLDNPFDSSFLANQKTSKGYMSMTKGAYNRMLRAYLKNRYTVEKPTSGRAYRNNKIVDMTYEVLTHETSVDKMLNPGGFDPQKKMGYLVEAYKLVGQNSGKYSWDNMKNMSIDELKDLTSSNKNLSYIDTHIQFYKQNSAAGSLIGIFAVNRIAHAVIESSSVDGSALYRFDVDRICKLSRPFIVAGMEFAGKMPFDMRYDRSGQLIGKVMGSLVAASVDAVKDPILNLMNINSNTANILNTLVRMGMPFEDAALFLSQTVIADVLAEHSRENITGFKALSTIIQERIDKYKKDNDLSESSDIHSEELTREELVKGLKDDTDGKIGYKTLRALRNFQSIAESMRMPTFATRFNSMSSAVGPLIIDNLISEHKMLKLLEQSNMWKVTETEDGEMMEEQVDMDDIFRDHPILAQFRRTMGIANTLLGNMPANSHGFRHILNILENSPLEDTIYGDRKLLSSLSDFYQSYLVMKGGVVDPSQLGRTITEFPKEFMENEYKKKYPDNALIQAIKYGTDKSGRATLQVDITGLDTQQKEKLSSAWTDLHKINPELSTKLFTYNFFRGGIGFSPKTFMALVPVYVKERIPGYVDTFRVLPSTVPEIVLDQFIRNNWDNNKLVPRRKVGIKQLKNGNWEVSNEEDYLKLITTPYFKMKIGDQDKMFHQVLQGEKTLEYAEISPLGSNKEYLEMSENPVKDPLNIPKTAEIDQLAERSELNEVGNTQFEGESTTETKTDDAVIEDLLYKTLVIDGVRTEEQVPQYIANYKAKSDADKATYEKHMKKFFRNRFDVLGIKYNEELIDKVYKKLC